MFYRSQVSDETLLLLMCATSLLITPDFSCIAFIQSHFFQIRVFRYQFSAQANLQKSCDMRFPAMWYVQLAKVQISLRIRAVTSEPLLVA